MLIPGISSVGAQTSNGSRSAPMRSSRAPRAASSHASAEKPEDAPGRYSDPDDPNAGGPKHGMTLAAAQAAYSSF
jgi:hypothetical protein